MGSIKRRHIDRVFLSTLLLSAPCFAEDYLNFFELPLDQLLQLKAETPGALTKLSRHDLPAAVTVITAKEIALTPARNIYDLLEIYVPGAIWLNQEVGPHPGIRGNITTRNYKFLLRVNGRLMNSKATFGAKSELEHWDMSDIQRIEVVRGPGSVTYGPGAVAGVINIITHDASSMKSNSVTTRSVSEYDSKGVSIQHRYQNGDNRWHTFVSVTRTGGYTDVRQFLADGDPVEAGFIGEDILPNGEALDYFADYQDMPQLKFHSEFSLNNYWDIWFRYTQQGSTWRGDETKTEFNGELLNQQSLRDRQATLVAEYANTLNDTLDFKSMISVGSFDAERRGGTERHPDPDNILNFNTNYSEAEWFLQGIFNWRYSENVEMAMGGEFSRTYFTSGWGDSRREMRLGSDGNVVSGLDSYFIPDRIDIDEATFVGNGWYTSTFSLFGEANIDYSDSYTGLLSARIDKNTFTDWLFSPRAALISRLQKDHVVKFIVQRSQRMNTAGELVTEHQNNIKSDPESLTSFEIAYSGQLNKQMLLKSHVFYNDTEVVDWNGEGTLDRSERIGDLKLAGLEVEWRYDFNAGFVGANYTFTKQLDWTLAPGVNISGISYSDANVALDGDPDLVMLGVGNDLNNWPNQAFKLFVRKQLTTYVYLHVDTRALWDYQGSLDGLIALENTVQGQPEELSVDAAIDRIRQEKTFEMDIRVNAAIAYQPNDYFSVSMFVQNLYGNNDNKRYAYDSGNDDPSPRRVRFVEEPRSIGITLKYQY